MFARRRAEVAADAARFDEMMDGLEVVLLANPWAVSWEVDDTNGVRIVSTDSGMAFGAPALWIYFRIDGWCCELLWIEHADPGTDSDEIDF
jgi:hypothetical protein